MNAPAFIPSAQQSAVSDWVLNGKGSLELVARAGCGKTSTLLMVSKTIYERNLGEIAIMAYNKAIADEVKAKTQSAGLTDWKKIQVGTVHSFGFGAWRKSAPNVTVDDKKVFNLIEKHVNKDAHRCVYRDCAATIYQAVGLAKQRAFGFLCEIEDRAQWFDLWDHFGLNDIGEDYEPAQVIEACIPIYKESLALCRDVVDFNDMILAPLYFKSRIWPKDWVLVDEAQDINPARRALALAMLKPRTGRMIFVGDDRQAIYGFTGADAEAMSLMRKAVNATTLPLNITYRCPKQVIAMAQRLVPDIQAAATAPEGTVKEMTQDEFMALADLTAADAVLCRNTAPIVALAFKLIRKGVACRVEGREIGSGLIKLARRWKVSTTDKLLVKLEKYLEREQTKWLAKGREEKAAAVADQVETLKVIIERCSLLQRHAVEEVIASINQMFGDTREGETAKVLTLSTIHKSKGREWDRVFILGRARYLPSPWARKEWQQVQEANLEYVALTRSKDTLVDVIVEAGE